MFILFSGCRDDDVDCGGEAESFKGRCFYILFNSPFGSTTRNKPRAVRPFRIFSQILGDIRSSRFATGVVATGGKGIVDSGGKFATSINNATEKGGTICCRWL